VRTGRSNVPLEHKCSSAEVKAAGYASGDPDLISRFNDGTDIYIYSAKLYLGDEGWGKLTKKQQKTWRKRFKTIC